MFFKIGLALRKDVMCGGDHLDTELIRIIAVKPALKSLKWKRYHFLQLSDPRNRNHKSLAIANRKFEVASFSRRNRSEIAVLQGVFGVAVIF